MELFGLAADDMGECIFGQLTREVCFVSPQSRNELRKACAVYGDQTRRKSIPKAMPDSGRPARLPAKT